MTEFKEVLPKIIKDLETFKKQGLIQGYALIGGMAVAARGFPRATKDIDFLISADEDFFRKEFSHKLSERGYITKMYKGDFEDPLRDLIRILDSDKNPLIDLILVHWRWQEDIIDAVDQLSLRGVHIPIVKAEDLVVLKLKAGSPRDLLDAEELIKVASLSDKWDKVRLHSLAKRAGVDKRLDRLLLKII